MFIHKYVRKDLLHKIINDCYKYSLYVLFIDIELYEINEAEREKNKI